jgi:stage V sporulation protein AE
LKRKVIAVTDGDSIAKQAVEAATASIGISCISASAGNPTPLNGYEMITLIEKAKYEPVVVMVDDRGNAGMGSGERVLSTLFHSDKIELLGVVAVASNSPKVRGVKVNASVDKNGKVVNSAVDKNGIRIEGKVLKGDTVNCLPDMEIPFIIGIGDPGKLEGEDAVEASTPILTKAILEIIRYYNNSGNEKTPQC